MSHFPEDCPGMMQDNSLLPTP